VSTRPPTPAKAPGAPAAGAAAATPDETALVAALKARDGAAYERLVREHGARLLAVARRILRDEAEAQDAVQDAFVSVFRAIDGFAGDARLSTWLHRIAVNAALLRLRGRRRRKEEPIEALLPAFRDDGHFAAPTVAWRDAAGGRLEDAETLALVRASIDRLPEDYRTVLVLRDIEGLDTKETARLLGVNENVAKIRLHRARLALRTMLDAHLRGDRP
jgi:RNA polymerase sigma-70 factor (ECF subfamily)